MTHPPPFSSEPTKLSPGLILFYSSCTAVGLGAALTAMMVVVFPNEAFTAPLAILGAVVVLAGGFGAWRFLKAARHER